MNATIFLIILAIALLAGFSSAGNDPILRDRMLRDHISLPAAEALGASVVVMLLLSLLGWLWL